MATSKKKENTSSRKNSKELRELGIEELNKMLSIQREELMHARFKHTVAQLEKTSELKAMRRQVARIETILTEKQQRA